MDQFADDNTGSQLQGGTMTMFDSSDNASAAQPLEENDASNAMKRKTPPLHGVSEDERANKMSKTEESAETNEYSENETSNGAYHGDNSTEDSQSAPKEESEAEDIQLTIEDLFTVYVSARRRNFRIPEEVVDEIKSEFASSGVTVMEVFSTNPFNFIVRVSTADEAQKLIDSFHKKVVAGLELFVKTKTPKIGQFQVKIKPTNANVCFDYEFAEEVADVLKKMDVDVHNCRGNRGQREIEINLFHEEDIPRVLEKFNNVNFGFIDVVAESHSETDYEEKSSLDTSANEGENGAQNDASSETSSNHENENLNCEPFVFAAMKTNQNSFTPSNMKVLCKAFTEEAIEVTRTSTASGGKFAYFFVKTWEDAEKFLSKYSNKLINNMLIGFEKGSKKSSYMQQNTSDQTNRYNNRGGAGGGFNRGGGAGFNSGGYHAPRGGAGFVNRGAGYGNRGGYFAGGGNQNWAGNRGGYYAHGYGGGRGAGGYGNFRGNYRGW